MLRTGLLRHIRNYMFRLGLLKRKHLPPPLPPIGRRPGRLLRKAPSKAAGAQTRFQMRPWVIHRQLPTSAQLCN